jgi:hypothetical protein
MFLRKTKYREKEQLKVKEIFCFLASGLFLLLFLFLCNVPAKDKAPGERATESERDFFTF